MKNRLAAILLAAVMTAGLLPLSACSGLSAATMHLRRTEGTVSVSNSSGKDIPSLDNLGLYSGYRVGTRPASYAWIDLDEVKLAKLDQNSEIAIEKEGRDLAIEVKSGSLFFNVTEPLADDETMNIRTSTLLVGVRGTCGWVDANNGLSRVYLLEGKVDCSAEGQTVQIQAGEMAELTPDGKLTVKEFTGGDLPAFVRDEVDSDLPGAAETPSPAPAETPEPSNTPEPTVEPAQGVTWSLENGTLTVGGTGPITSKPWDADRDQIQTVIIGSGVTSMGYGAFSGCSSLTDVIILEGVTSIGTYAFSNCKKLVRVTIPNSVTFIGSDAFSGCSSLESVTIPGRVASIERQAFAGCRGLTSLTFLDGVASIGPSAFSDCSSLERVTIPGSVTNIYTYAFSGCSALTDVTMLEGVGSIWARAFTDCTSLSRVSIPDSVTFIGSDAFSNCRKLESVTIPGSVTNMGNDAFYGCIGLTGLTILDGVTSIPASAFDSCSALERVTIPGSVTSIAFGAFSGCSSLTDVYYGGDESQWGEIIIGGYNNSLTDAAIHYNSTGN